MEQHVISEWLLKAFARIGSDGPTLAVFDKETGGYESTSPDHFMTEVDAHSPHIERLIHNIETPAAQAAQRLAKRVRALPPGLYAVMDEHSAAVISGPALSDKGVLEGMRLFVSEKQLPSPTQADRRALSEFVGLMYQRAPKVERAIMKMGVDYDAAVQTSLNSLVPGMRSNLTTELARRRSRMIGLAQGIGTHLASVNWWVLRAGQDEAFVLGDSPVAATAALGHDDVWRAILSGGASAIVMPLGPAVALIIAPRSILPFSNLDFSDLTRAINRLIWRWAEQHVLAGDRSHLEAVWPSYDDRSRRSSVSAEVDSNRLAMSAAGDVGMIVMQGRWQRWVVHRFTFGRQPWDADNPHMLVSHPEEPLRPSMGIGTLSRAPDRPRAVLQRSDP